MDKIDKVIKHFRSLREEMSVSSVSANNLSSGNIAGTSQAGDDPPIRKRNRYIWLKGIRKNWKK